MALGLKPFTLSRVEDHDQLTMKASATTAHLHPAERDTAHVELKDGRLLKVPVTVEPPRPQVTLLSKGIQEETSALPSPAQMGSPDDLPLEGRLVFFLKSTVPSKFPRSEKVELAAEDGSFDTELFLYGGKHRSEDAIKIRGGKPAAAHPPRRLRLWTRQSACALGERSRRRMAPPGNARAAPRL